MGVDYSWWYAMLKYMAENLNDKPLTVKHIYEVLIPEMEKVFVTKDEFTKFKDKSLTNQDRMLKDLKTLMIEKTVGYHQKEKERKLWALMIDAMREHRILSPEQLKQIKELEVF